MKKTIIFSLLVAVATAFIGCSTGATDTDHSGPGVMVSDTTSKTYTYPAPILAPRYGCDGKRLPEDKVIGWEERGAAFPLETNYIGDDVLNPAGYYYDAAKDTRLASVAPAATAKETVAPTRPSSSDDNENGLGWGWGWIGDLFQIILAIIALALALWFLWWLFNQRPNSSGGNRNAGAGGGGNNGNGGNNAANGNNQHSIVIIREDHTPRSGADTNASLTAFFAGVNSTIESLHKNGGGNVDLVFGDENIDTSATIHVGPEPDESK